MKDIMQPTPESFLNKLAELCLKYGINKAEHFNFQKMKFCAMMAFFNKSKEDDLKPELKTEYRKELATLTNIFKNGRSITIEAALQEDNKEKHITLPIETNGLLQKEVHSFLASLLAKYHFETLGITTKKDDLEADFTDKELADIIKFEEKFHSYKEAMKGRTEKEIPRLGSKVHCFIGACADMLATLKPTEKYCFIGDIMLAAGVLPIEQEEWEKVLTNKEKADKVKSWKASFLNQHKKHPIP